MRLLTGITAVLVLLVGVGCGDDDDDDAAGTSTTEDATTTTVEEPSTTTTADTALPGGELVPCENPEGFTISAPEGWSTNSGDVVPPCSQWDPQPFEVPAGTDERVAAITAFVDPVDFATAARPVQGRSEDRAVTAVDGRQAVRVAYDATGDALLPEGTPVTRYVVDLTSTDGEPATLFIDTIGTDGFDYEQNVVVLDRMAQTLDVTASDVATAPEVIASYQGGGGGFEVEASLAGQPPEACLRIPPGGEPVCTDQPAPDQVHTIVLQDLGSVQAGVTGSSVWRIELTEPGGETHAYLPARVPGSDLGAYAFPETVESFERLVLRDVTGNELRTVEPGER